MPKFNQQAHSYDSHSGLQRVLAHQLINACPNKNLDNILDLGCGTGHLTEKLIQKYPQALITALDHSSEMLLILKNKANNKRLKTINKNIETFQPINSFDLIISNLAFQWLKNSLEQIQRYTQYLNQGGYLIINLLDNQSFILLQKSYQQCQLPYQGIDLLSASQIHQLANSFILKHHQISTYFTSTQSFYRAIHQIGATSISNQISVAQLYRIIKYHNQLYPHLIPFDYSYHLIIYNK